MGKTDQWFLDDHAVHGYLENGPTLVMFDGLDEIFDTGDRQRVMQEIAGFAQRYPRARIVVTSRPVGYREQVLRDAGFAHFGLQDLDDGQIETFVRGWFALTFPQQSRQAEQRIERVLGSVRQSKPMPGDRRDGPLFVRAPGLGHHQGERRGGAYLIWGGRTASVPTQRTPGGGARLS